MTGSGVDTEVELILARSSIFSFPSNVSDMDISPVQYGVCGHTFPVFRVKKNTLHHLLAV